VTPRCRPGDGVMGRMEGQPVVFRRGADNNVPARCPARRACPTGRRCLVLPPQSRFRHSRARNSRTCLQHPSLSTHALLLDSAVSQHLRETAVVPSGRAGGVASDIRVPHPMAGYPRALQVFHFPCAAITCFHVIRSRTPTPSAFPDTTPLNGGYRLTTSANSPALSTYGS